MPSMNLESLDRVDNDTANEEGKDNAPKTPPIGLRSLSVQDQGQISMISTFSKSVVSNPSTYQSPAAAAAAAAMKTHGLGRLLPRVTLALIVVLAAALAAPAEADAAASLQGSGLRSKQQQQQHRSLRQLSSSSARKVSPPSLKEIRKLYSSNNEDGGAADDEGDDEVGSGTTTSRVLINQFELLLTSSVAAGDSSSSGGGILASSSSSEGQQQLKALHQTTEATIQAYVESQDLEGGTVSSILLGAVSVASSVSSSESEGSNPYYEVAKVSFGKGVVNFATDPSGSTAPSSYQVNVWVQEAVDKALLTALLNDNNSTTGFRSALPIGRVQYVELVDNPKPAEEDPPRNSTADGIQDGPNDPVASSSSSLNVTLLIVLCAVGFAVVVSAVGLLVMRRRNNNHKDKTPYVEQRNPAYSVKEMMEDALDESTSKDADDYEGGAIAIVAPAGKKNRGGGSVAGGSDDLNTTRETIKASSVASNSPGRQSVVSAASSNNGSDKGSGRNNTSIGYFSARSGNSSSRKLGSAAGSDKGLNETMDGKSVAGESESDFTVNTEAGDSLALQSVSGYQAPNASSGQLVPHPQQPRKILLAPPPFAATESFQRERPVNLQKDMLVSSWSGGARPAGGGNVRISSTSPTSSSIRMVPQPQQLLLQPHQAQSDSVLTPSHFVAAQEKEQQKKSPRGSNGLSSKLSVSTSWSRRRRQQPQLEEGDNEGSAGEDTDYDGSVSVDSGSAASEVRQVVASASSSPPSLLGRRSNGKNSPTVPQTPPSATSRQRFIGPPRPSPGNVV